MGVRISGTGSYRPERVVTNDEFSDKRFRIKGGSKERRHASEHETSRLMLARAGGMALADAGGSNDVDLVIAYSGMPDYLYPKDGTLLVEDLMLGDVAVWSVDTACSSFITAMRIGSALIEAGQFKRVLIAVAMRWIDRGIDKDNTDYSSLGDGAAAVVLERSDRGGMLSCVEKTDPEGFDFVTLKSPFATNAEESLTFSTNPKYREYFGVTVLEVAKKAIKESGVSAEKIDGFLPHQVGATLLHVWAESLGLAEGTLCHTFDLCGNMSAVNIPMSLDHHRKLAAIMPGDKLLFFSPGAGMHLAAMVWEHA